MYIHIKVASSKVNVYESIFQFCVKISFFFLKATFLRQKEIQKVADSITRLQLRFAADKNVIQFKSEILICWQDSNYTDWYRKCKRSTSYVTRWQFENESRGELSERRGKEKENEKGQMRERVGVRREQRAAWIDDHVFYVNTILCIIKCMQPGLR